MCVFTLYEQKVLTEAEVETFKSVPTYPFVKIDAMLTYVSLYKENYYAEAISRYFYVANVVRSFEAESFCDILNVDTFFGNKAITVDRNIFSTHRFEEMNTLGLVFNNDKVKLLLKYINICEALAPAITEYRSVGWICKDDGCAFYGLESDEALHYIGEKDLSSRGESSDYIEAMNRLLYGRTGLEIALLTSLSSALVGLLSKHTPTESFLVHLYGMSSNGKTTALQLAASVWGNPAMGKGLLSSWNATDNAIFSKLNYNFGIVQCLDESSCLTRQFSGLLYAFSQNTGKNRLSKSSQLQVEKKFCTSILSSGENSLLSASNQNLGLRVRILELFDVPLTDSAIHSDEIKKFTSQNYGTLGAEFVKVLAELNDASIMETLGKWKNLILSKIKLKNQISERLTLKYAILLTTANIAQEFLGLNVDMENIINFLVRHHDDFGLEASIGERAYNCVLDWLAKNRGKLLTQTCRESK